MGSRHGIGARRDPDHTARARGALVKVLDKPYLTSNTMGRVGEHVLILELALRKIANRKRPRLGGVSSRSRKRAGSITSLKRLTHGAGGIARRFPFQKAASSAHQNFAWTCWMSFLAKHCPKRCSTNNPPSDVIGVVALGAPRSRCRDSNVAGKTQVDLRKG